MEPHDGQSQVSLPDHGSVTILLLPPATKLGQGYVFTRVCDSVHRGVGVVSVSVLGVGVGLSLCPGGVSVMETPCAVMSGRYASYWNAFLFSRILTRSKGKEGTRNQPISVLSRSSPIH